MKVFLSRPTLIPEQFERGFKQFEKYVKKQGMKLHTVGIEEYPLENPLDAVINLMKSCDGVIVLGYPQIEITSGILKPGTSGSKKVKGMLLATEWNHIETAIAYTLKKPVLIIHHKEIARGVFDKGGVNNILFSEDLRREDWITEKRIQGVFRRFSCNTSKLKLRNEWKRLSPDEDGDDWWKWTVFLEDNKCGDLSRVDYVEYKLDESYESYKEEDFIVKMEDRACTVTNNNVNKQWGFSFAEEAFEPFTIKAKIYLIDGTIWETKHSLDLRKEPENGISN